MVRRKHAQRAAVLVLILLLVIPGGILPAEKNLVADQAGLFTSDQVTELEAEARALGEEYNLDIVIVTTEDAQGKSSRDYADDYYEVNGYGTAPEYSGILLLIDLDNREAYISTEGEGIRYLTDQRIERVLDAVFDGGLTDGDMYGAARAFLSATQGYLAAGIPSGQYNVPEPAANSLNMAESLAGLAVSALSGAGFFALIKRRYKGKPEPAVFEFRKNSLVDLQVTSDNLYNTYVTTRIIPKQTTSSAGSSGRSTTHRSSGGRIHGGGGRKF